jgi:hypothetical protein
MHLFLRAVILHAPAYVLDSGEVVLVQQRINTFNQIIEEMAGSLRNTAKEIS